jgi:hypothetical protein
MLARMDIDFGPPDRQGDLPGTPLQQCATYAAVLGAFGCTSAVADISCGGVLLARARVHLRRFGPLRLAWLPRGPVWTPAAAPDARRAAPWRAIWAMGGTAGEAHHGWAVARGSDLAELDLRPPDTGRRAAQHGKWRNRLGRAERAGLTFTARPIALPQDAPLLARETAQRRTRGYAALPQAFTEKWAALAPEATVMLTAAEGGAPVAFMLMLLHGQVATYHAGWSGSRGRALNAHTLLLWRASQILSQRGYQRLDLGRIDPARAPGLARFKLGAGAVPRALGATTLCL